MTPLAPAIHHTAVTYFRRTSFMVRPFRWQRSSVASFELKRGFHSGEREAQPSGGEEIDEGAKQSVAAKELPDLLLSTAAHLSPIYAAMPPAPPKIGFVSLGCAKALVDSERIITRLRAEGYELSASYEGADAVVVNTCGFLNSAKEESLEAIGEALAENG